MTKEHSSYKKIYDGIARDEMLLIAEKHMGELEKGDTRRKFYQMGYDEAQKDHIESLKRIRDNVVDVDFKGWHTASTTEEFVDLAERYGRNTANAIIRQAIDKELNEQVEPDLDNDD